MRKCLLAPLLLILLFFTATVSHAQVAILSDGDFSTWTLERSLGSASFAREAVGGNPGAHLQLTATAAASVVTVEEPTVVYDPGTQGAISDISLTADVIGASALSPVGAALVLCLFQGGDFFAGPGIPFDSQTWTGVSSLNLKPFDFTAGGLLTPPDFSSAGGAMTFGLCAAGGLTGGAAFSVDNVEIALLQAPPVVPALDTGYRPFLLALLVGTGFLASRRARASVPHDA